jgi:lipopolysaccharide export LptBFGC system permease protein LptF
MMDIETALCLGYWAIAAVVFGYSFTSTNSRGGTEFIADIIIGIIWPVSILARLGSWIARRLQ